MRIFLPVIEIIVLEKFLILWFLDASSNSLKIHLSRHHKNVKQISVTINQMSWYSGKITCRLRIHPLVKNWAKTIVTIVKRPILSWLHEKGPNRRSKHQKNWRPITKFLCFLAGAFSKKNTQVEFSIGTDTNIKKSVRLFPRGWKKLQILCGDHP